MKTTKLYLSLAMLAVAYWHVALSAQTTEIVIPTTLPAGIYTVTAKLPPAPPPPQPPATHTLTAAPATVGPAGTVTVTYTAPANHGSQDWIGLFAVGASNQDFKSYKYVPAGASGSVTLTAPTTPGGIELRYLPNNGYTSVATSNTITVTAAGGTPQPPPPPTTQPPTSQHPVLDSARNEPVIAAWGTVPRQVVTGTLNLSAFAVHINGVSTMSISAGGRPLAVTRSGDEFIATLNAADHPDGTVSVTGIAQSPAGQATTLETLTFLANSRGSIPQPVRFVSPTGNDNNAGTTAQQPKRTIYAAVRGMVEAENGIVQALAGDYSWSGAANRGPAGQTSRAWVTIQPAPGVTRDQVRITSSSSSDALAAKFVRLKGITVSANLIEATSVGASLWFDESALTGALPNDSIPHAGPSMWGTVYVTDSIVSKTAHGQGGKLLRNVLVDSISNDAFGGSSTVINCTARNMTASGGSHPDVWQNGGFSASNVFLYGIKATDNVGGQGVAVKNSTIRNFAIINSEISSRPPFQVLEFGGPTTNLLIRGNKLSGGGGFRLDQGFVPTNVMVESTTFNGGARPVVQAPGVGYR